MSLNLSGERLDMMTLDVTLVASRSAGRITITYGSIKKLGRSQRHTMAEKAPWRAFELENVIAS